MARTSIPLPFESVKTSTAVPSGILPKGARVAAPVPWVDADDAAMAASERAAAMALRVIFSLMRGGPTPRARAGSFALRAHGRVSARPTPGLGPATLALTRSRPGVCATHPRARAGYARAHALTAGCLRDPPLGSGRLRSRSRAHGRVSARPTPGLGPATLALTRSRPGVCATHPRARAGYARAHALTAGCHTGPRRRQGSGELAEAPSGAKAAHPRASGRLRSRYALAAG